MLTQSAADALIESAEEFTRLAGLDLDARQQAELRDVLRVRHKTGTWRWSRWSVRHPGHDTELVAARVLLGFLVLGENVVWTAKRRVALLDPFRLLCTSVGRLGTPAGGLTQFDVDGIPVRVKRANGDEQLERLDTGARIQFICRSYLGALRGASVDLAVVDEAHAYPPGQLEELLPVLACRPNPQIVYM